MSGGMQCHAETPSVPPGLVSRIHNHPFVLHTKTGLEKAKVPLPRALFSPSFPRLSSWRVKGIADLHRWREGGRREKCNTNTIGKNPHAWEAKPQRRKSQGHNSYSENLFCPPNFESFFSSVGWWYNLISDENSSCKTWRRAKLCTAKISMLQEQIFGAVDMSSGFIQTHTRL